MNPCDDLKMAQSTKKDMGGRDSRTSRCSNPSRASNHMSKQLGEVIAVKVFDRLKKIIEEEIMARSQHNRRGRSLSKGTGNNVDSRASRDDGRRRSNGGREGTAGSYRTPDSNSSRRCHSVGRAFSGASYRPQSVQRDRELGTRTPKAEKYKRRRLCPRPNCRILGRCMCEKLRNHSMSEGDGTGVVKPKVSYETKIHRQSPLIRKIDPNEKWLSFHEMGEYGLKKREADRKRWFRQWYKSHEEQLSRKEPKFDAARVKSDKKKATVGFSKSFLSHRLGTAVRGVNGDTKAKPSGKGSHRNTCGSTIPLTRSMAPVESVPTRNRNNSLWQSQSEVADKKEPHGQQQQQQQQKRSSFYVRPGSGPPGSIELVVRNSSTPEELGAPRKVDVRVFRTHPLAECMLRSYGKGPRLRKTTVPGLERVRVRSPFGGFPKRDANRKMQSESSRKFPAIRSIAGRD